MIPTPRPTIPFDHSMRKVYSRVAYARKPSLMRRAAPDLDHAGQIQAFGIADLGMGAELGYISIP